MQRMRSRGFTLVELLVVIGIIALLIGILLPALNRARDAANTVKCESNLRSIGQGLADYLANYQGAYPACYYYVGQKVQNGVETPPFAQQGYVHWSSFLYGRKDLAFGYPQSFTSTLGWEAFQCPSINNGGLPADDPSPGNSDPGQTASEEGPIPAPFIDYQAPRMAYTANEAIMGTNKYVIGYQGAERIYRFVKAGSVRHAGNTILVTEFNQDWNVVSDSQDQNATAHSPPFVCKSHRPVNAFVNIQGGPGAYQIWLDAPGLTPINFTRATIEGWCTPYPHLGSPAIGNTVTSLDWVGRNHGQFKLGSVQGSNTKNMVSGWDMRTSNFLYCDGHVENKNLADTLRFGAGWQWGDDFYSLTPNGDHSPW
jgi:prepilin-type N-terminal cleavage/methylation domain-containing protein/prepilin-type processing-associated H-X9-DG protein